MARIRHPPRSTTGAARSDSAEHRGPYPDICRLRGLTGDQGVVVPDANVKYLMRRADVVAAAAAGRFHIHAVASVEDAIELLTGVPAGEPDADGVAPAGSINRRVATQLTRLFEMRRALSPAGKAAGGRRRKSSQ